MAHIDRWFAVARSEEIIARQVGQAQLLGQEIALWRDDSGAVNAWENRCPHRGVRLSLGFNIGMELRCQYHGWRFAAGSGQCTHIPAHPSQKPANTIRAAPYGCEERYGFVWVTLAELPTQLHGQQADGVEHVRRGPSLPGLEGPHTTLRSVFIEARAAAVADSLSQGQGLLGVPAEVTAHDEYTLTVAPQPASSGAGSSATAEPAVTFLLQPVTATQTLLHAVLHAEFAGAERLAALRRHHLRMTALRDALEAEATTPWSHRMTALQDALKTVPAQRPGPGA